MISNEESSHVGMNRGDIIIVEGDFIEVTRCGHVGPLCHVPLKLLVLDQELATHVDLKFAASISGTTIASSYHRWSTGAILP
ncbi:hypothetical protein Tco_1457634 [Tanacetum coccineum]